MGPFPAMLIASLFSSQLAHAGPGDEGLAKWRPGDRENGWKTAALVFPRMIERLGGSLYQSATLHRIKNTVCARIESFIDDDQAAIDASNSLVNLGGTLNALVSDAAGVTKEALAFKGRPFPRLRICEQNLTEAYHGAIQRPVLGSFIDPAVHVSLVLDGVNEYGDSSGTMKEAIDTRDSAVCKNVDIISGEPPSVALQRLHCATAKFKYEYQFLGYNCGGVAHDLLRMSGFNSPTFPNLGIGSDLPIPTAAWKKSKATQPDVVNACDEQVHRFYGLLKTLNDSKTPPKDQIDYFLSAFEKNEIGPDASLQLVILGTMAPQPRSEELNRLFDRAASVAKGYAAAVLAAPRKYTQGGLNEWRSTLRGILGVRLEHIRGLMGAETFARLVGDAS